MDILKFPSQKEINLFEGSARFCGVQPSLEKTKEKYFLMSDLFCDLKNSADYFLSPERTKVFFTSSN